jgi:hypothetical protein
VAEGAGKNNGVLRGAASSVAITLLLSLVACGAGGSNSSHLSRNEVRVASVLTATIDGHIFTDGRSVYPNGGFVEQTASLLWTIVYTGQLKFNTESHQYGVTGSAWKIVRMDGTVHWAGTGGLECSGNLSTNPRALSMDLSPYVYVTPAPSASASGEQFVVDGAVPDDKIVVSSDT